MIGVIAMLDVESFLLGIAAGGGGGGSNPNYVETITGTLANPFGSYTMAEIQQMISTKSASFFITFTDEHGHEQTLAGTGAVEPGEYSELYFSVVYVTGTSTSYSAYAIVYDAVENSMLYAIELIGRTRTDLSSSTSCTLTIIHHPLP